MNENVKTYLIPNNFIDEGRVFNGAIRTRYLIEAIIIFIAIAGPCWLFIPNTVTAKFGITLGCSLPFTMLALVGINGDSLSGFIKAAWSWRKERQIMLYNDNTRTYMARPVDVMLSEVNASDVLVNSLEKWRTQRSMRDVNVELIENIDFVFMEDDEFEKMTPQDIREKKKREKKEAEKARKNSKKNKKRSAPLPEDGNIAEQTQEEAVMSNPEESSADSKELSGSIEEPVVNDEESSNNPEETDVECKAAPINLEKSSVVTKEVPDDETANNVKEPDSTEEIDSTDLDSEVEVFSFAEETVETKETEVEMAEPKSEEEPEFFSFIDDNPDSQSSGENNQTQHEISVSDTSKGNMPLENKSLGKNTDISVSAEYEQDPPVKRSIKRRKKSKRKTVNTNNPPVTDGKFHD